MEGIAYGVWMPRNIVFRDLTLRKVAEEILIEKGTYDTMMFSSSGPGGVFGLYVMPGTNLHRVLLNEFVMVINEIQPEYSIYLTIIS
jgi:hypothetical protein